MTGTSHIRSFLLIASSLLLILLPSSCVAFWKVNEDASTIDGEKTEKADPPKLSDRKLEEVPVEYGVDVSFPMHHTHVSDNYAWLEHNMNPDVPTPDKYKDMVVQPLGDREAFYKNFVDGCVKHFGSRGKLCVSTERDRVEMSLRQPQSMQNYTKTGYKKLRAPDKVFSLIKDFWERNKGRQQLETWGAGNTYTNNWDFPTYMVSVEDTRLRGAGYGLKQQIWNAARDTLEEWTGEELTECSLYGIRVYKDGAVLSTHVDRLPLVSSAIINVDQDLDEPWPLEVIGHDGKATNVTMEPGDMVLYESHSVLHGRPFPLKGRFFANIFIHFEPVGHTLRHHNMEGAGGDVERQYREALESGQAGHEHEETGLPPYIIPGTPEVANWRRSHPGGYKGKKPQSFATGSTSVHVAASNGRLGELKRLVGEKNDVVHKRDENGWTPLHEGARGGHLDVVKYLVEKGADVDAKTYGDGGTALWWAKQTHDENHPVVQFLEEIGALDAGPEL